jgi:hypothetical protein
MIIDLLDLDLAAGKPWTQLVVEEMRAQRRLSDRAAWLRRQGRHDEADKSPAIRNSIRPSRRAGPGSGGPRVRGQLIILP